MSEKTAKKKLGLEATVETVKSALGSTWFDIQDEGDSILIDTRMHGDVGNERAGQADKVEGRRLESLLRKTFKPSQWVTEYDVIDEWVSISLRKARRSKQEKAVIQMQKLGVKWRNRVREAVQAANSKIDGTNIKQTFAGFVSDRQNVEVSITTIYGHRLLYHNHLGSQFAFAEAGVAESALKEFLAQFPELSWDITTYPLQEHLTGNYSPPNNVIERQGAVTGKAVVR